MEEPRVRALTGAAMLRTLFQWLDVHPESYWFVLAIPTAGWIALALPPWRAKPGAANAPRGDKFFLLLTLVVLVAWRWPFWLNAEAYNVDESQFIAGALTLSRDLSYWRALDATTSGPLNIYALLPFHWIGLPLDYFSARVTGVALVWTALAGCFLLIRSWHGRVVARLALLPLTGFFAAATDADFIHYSSEHVSLALFAFAAAGLLGPSRPEQRRRFFLLSGFLAGALPWAKLQTAPLAAVLVLLGLWRVWTDTPRNTRLRAALKLVAASVLPSALAVTVATATGQFGNLYHDYVLQNLFYISQDWPYSSAIRQLWAFSLVTGNLPTLLAVCVGGVLYAFLQGRPFRNFFFGASALLTVVAVCCVLAPKRASLHYTLLAVVPLGCWLGAALGAIREQVGRELGLRHPAVLYGLEAALLILFVRAGQGTPAIFGQFTDHWRQPRSAAGAIVRTITSPADRIAVWGYTDRIYVEAGRAQATHESETFEQIGPSVQREHYRARYLADLRRNRPPVFVDATGPGAFYYPDRASARHENAPEIAEYVRENYSLLTDLGSARIFVTPQRLAERPVSDAALWRMISEARRNPDPAQPISLTPRLAARKKIHNRTVQMMLPAAEMIWALDGSERELVLEYGFDPQAYREGHGDGADLIVELRTPDQATVRLFNRRLDPFLRADDRGHLVSRIVLPPFPAGAKLVLRTTPGEFDNDAWDWIYVGRLDWVRSPNFAPSQFPGFSRVPDQIHSAALSIVDAPDGKLLMSHAPATMSFPLRKNDRSLKFDFGFESGAYTGPDRTDGAIFRVYLAHGGTTSELFSRKLYPANRDDDRGRQHAEVAIPKIETGDELRLIIDPGGNASWDWTYVTNLAIDPLAAGL